MSQLANINKEYEQDLKIKKEDVEQLRLWAEKQPHLPKISELQYILFLQSCYYSNEQAKRVIDNFFTIRTLSKDLFSNLDPKSRAIQNSIDVCAVCLLPKLAPSGYKILFFKLFDTNPDKYNFLDHMRTIDMIITLKMHIDGTNEGIHLVADLEGATFSHLLKYNPIILKKFLFYVQEALPIRLKDIHVFHAPSWIDKALALFKPFLKKELYDMIHIHPNMESFYKIIPQDRLPKDCGGDIAETLPELTGECNGLLTKNIEFFKNLENQVTNESKRTEKFEDYSKIFGLEGTFKKLDID